ncbi:MAG: RNA methyltransferase [Bacteroidota bacterium]
MNPKRAETIERVLEKRQGNITVLMENVIDQHNIGAVLRSCDSIGVHEIFVLNNEEGLKGDFITIGKRTSSGARKWLNVHYYNDTEACFKHIRKYYSKIYTTKLSSDAKSLYDLDLADSVALVFGNEQYGITPESLALADQNFIIPQVGMTQSLNISVACAVTLYEAYRQRLRKGFYEENNPMTESMRNTLRTEYHRRHEEQDNQEIILKIK